MKSTFLYKSLSSSHFCPEKNLRYTTDGSKNMKILKTHTKSKGPSERYNFLHPVYKNETGIFTN